MRCSLNELYYRALSYKIYKYTKVSETKQGRECGYNFCKYVEDNKHMFENKVLVNRIHKCEMYERMRNKQIETYNNYMEKYKMILI